MGISIDTRARTFVTVGALSASDAPSGAGLGVSAFSGSASLPLLLSASLLGGLLLLRPART